MGREIRFDGKQWRIWSSVVEDFVSDPLDSSEAVAKWVRDECKHFNSPEVLDKTGERLVVSPLELKCRCEGEVLGREEKSMLWFEKGVSLAKLSSRHLGLGFTEISSDDYCGLVAARALVEALEAELAYRTGYRVRPD